MKPAKKKGKVGKKKAPNSLLTRLLKGKDKKKDSGQSTSAVGGLSAAKDKPPTPLDRSIREIKQLLGVGQSDPERLALLLSNLLGAEREKLEKDQQNFDQMVWDIVNREEQGSGGDAGTNGADGPSANGNGKEGLN